MVRVLVTLLALGLGLGLGCSASERECRVGADCASGSCRLDGTCAPGSGGGGGGGSAPARDGAPADGTQAQADATGARLDAPASCTNHDGLIERREIMLGEGLSAPFEIALDAPIDLGGERRPDGTRRWDLSRALPGDRRVVTTTLSPAGRWFEARFPGATYATRLSERQDLLGIFRVEEGALLLLGVASLEDGPAATEIHYAPPVTVLQFPLRAGARWTTTSMVTSRVLGATLFYSEAYDSDVDASGVLATPLGEFPVQRVRTVLRRTVGLQVTTIRSFSFLSECYGTVGLASSRDNEPAEEFTVASEARRLAP